MASVHTFRPTSLLWRLVTALASSPVSNPSMNFLETRSPKLTLSLHPPHCQLSPPAYRQKNWSDKLKTRFVHQWGGADLGPSYVCFFWNCGWVLIKNKGTQFPLGTFWRKCCKKCPIRIKRVLLQENRNTWVRVETGPRYVFLKVDKTDRHIHVQLMDTWNFTGVGSRFEY